MKELIELLESFGVSTANSGGSLASACFPVAIPLRDGNVLRLELPEPPFLACLDPELLGAAIVDPLGIVAANWGIASKMPLLRTAKSLFDTPLRSLLDGTPKASGDSLYLEGKRFFVSALGPGVGALKFLMVVDASQEDSLRFQARQTRRAAEVLARLGKTFTMNQNCEPLCVAATHEIASSLELAAALLWVSEPSESCLTLAASVGATRNGISAIRRIHPESGSSCAAEIVASTGKVFSVAHVAEHILTADLEAKLCYLKPGGMSALPLEINGHLLGVLEMIGREGDPYFNDSRSLFETIAEHLALAINSSSLFENLERLATHDPLTGLGNHRHMQDFLHQRIKEAERTEGVLGLLMVDVDHFRSFNEEEGHDAGDAVLKLVADTLHTCVRPYDIAARYGGEEFVIVMPGSGMEAAASVAERIRKRVEVRPFCTKSGRNTHVTVSIGCAAFPDSANDASGLLKAADIALYEAKRVGRNQVVRFSGSSLATSRKPAVTLDAVQAWMSEEEWSAARDRVSRFQQEVEALATKLKLSDSQVEMLNALLLIAPKYQEWLEEEDEESLRKADAADEFRVLLPSLHSLRERFNGQEGNRIPLLGRVLQALLAIESGTTLYEDPGRYDPEIVRLITERHRAA